MAEGENMHELTEEEIMKKLTIAQMRERLMQQLREMEEEEKRLNEKMQGIREQIFTEMKEKYGLSEKEIEQAFRERKEKDKIINAIIDAIQKKGSDACKEKKIREKMDAWKRIYICEHMAEEDVKKIAMYVKAAREYLEEQQVQTGKALIHHAGRMSTEALQMLKFIKDHGCRIQWKELLRFGKEELGLDSDTINKRRWNLLTKEYIRREGTELVLTEKGLARLQEEGL